jgi:hypothetical protein
MILFCSLEVSSSTLDGAHGGIWLAFFWILQLWAIKSLVGGRQLMIAIHGSKDYILPETLINASCGASFSIPSWLLAILEERSLQLSLKNVQFASW